MIPVLLARGRATTASRSRPPRPDSARSSRPRGLPTWRRPTPGRMVACVAHQRPRSKPGTPAGQHRQRGAHRGGDTQPRTRRDGGTPCRRRTSCSELHRLRVGDVVHPRLNQQGNRLPLQPGLPYLWLVGGRGSVSIPPPVRPEWRMTTLACCDSMHLRDSDEANRSNPT